MYTDQQSDPSKKLLYSLLGNVKDEALRTSLKGSSYDGPGMAKLPQSKFAQPGQRKFPVDTPENTALSKVYFDHQAGSMPKADADSIGKSLNVHMQLHSLPEDAFSYNTEQAMPKVAEDTPEGKYLLPEHEFCKVASKGDLAKAEVLFDSGFDQLRLSDRVTFSTNFLKTAEEFSFVVTSENIEKYAGVLDYDSMHTQYALELRSGLASRRGHSTDGYRKLAAALDSVQGKPTKKELKKLASLIEGMDKEAGIEEKDYDKTIHSPQGVVFSKVADEPSEVTENTEGMSKADIVGKYGEGALEIVEDEDGTLNEEAVKRLNDMHKGLKPSLDKGGK